VTNHRFAVALALVVASLAEVRADVFTFTLAGTAALPSTPASPYTATAANPSATTGLLGYSLSGNWTAGTGSPNSIDLRVALTTPGGSSSPFQQAGGNPNSSAYTFGTGVNNGIAFNLPGTSPPNFSSGNYTVSIYQGATGTSASLDNGTVSVYSKPSSYSWTTTGGPTFVRPDIGTASPGVPVAYRANTFTVSASGRYMFVNAAQYDSVVLLYANSFDPLNPNNNLVSGGDYPYPPFAPIGDTFVADLSTGTTYYLVSTGYFDESGAYTAFAAGPGTATFTPIPEPGTMFVTAAGLLTAGAWFRRRVRNKFVCS